MDGLFGGRLARREGGLVELVDAEFASLFAPPSGDRPAPAGPPAERRARVVSFCGAGDCLRYDDALEALSPLGAAPGGLARELGALGGAARALAALHEAGAVHGDVRPATVWLGPGDDVALVRAAAGPTPATLLRARLRRGADPGDVGYVAPEVVGGDDASPASDVFALAAVAFRAVTGFAPLGQVERPDATGLLGELGAVVATALSAAPGARPPMARLASELERAAERAAKASGAPATLAGPGRAWPAAGAPDAATERARQQAGQMSVVLAVVLTIGGLFAFVGAAMLVAAGWSRAGDLGRFALMMVAALATGAGGAAARRRGHEGSGLALLAVGAVLACTDAAYLFSLAGRGERLGLLFALTLGAAAGGALCLRRGLPRSGLALTALGTQLLWVDGGYSLSLSGLAGEPRPWALVAAAVAAASAAAALALRSATLATLAALGLAAAAACLGASLPRAMSEGPALYALAVALLFASVAAVASARAGDDVGVPFALGALASAWVSAGFGLVLAATAGAGARFGSLWPYLVAALAIVAARRARAPYEAIAGGTAGAVLVVAAPAEALAREDSIAYLFAAVAAGFATLAATSSRRLRPAEAWRGAWTAVGLACGVAPSAALFLFRFHDRPGVDLFASADAIYFSVLCGVTAGLLALAYAASGRSAARAHYRPLEYAAAAHFFGPLTLLSALRPDDYVYPAVVLAVGLALLAAGARTRRAAPATTAGAALALDVWVQYFAKLTGEVSLPVLLVGFGIGLLVCGAAYERAIKALRAGLRGWA